MYPTLSDSLSFDEYISQCREIISKSRKDLVIKGANKERIIEANTPFELKPDNFRKGALLIHGLFDCPFSMRDIANTLHANNILCRSILLPGHGTRPEDLLDVKYEQWIDAVNYGIEKLADEVEDITLIGYSTGAALSVYHALHHPRINRIVLLAPAIRINETLDMFIGWNRFAKKLKKRRKWLTQDEETNYAKYTSVTFNSVLQISKLTKLIARETHEKPVKCPIQMIVSREDETISSHMAVDFFSSQKNEKSRLLLYTSHANKRFCDQRILPRSSTFPEMRIKHFSHPSIMFEPDNFHNGMNGDNPHASHKTTNNVIYGAYNALEVNFFDLLYNLGLAKDRRRTLSYNPDFEFMSNQVVDFIDN